VLFYQTKEFKTLAKEWEQKLIASGFVDAEKLQSGQTRAHYGEASYKRTKKEIIDARIQYYSTFCYHAYRTFYPKYLDREVVTRFAKGSRISDIVVELRELGVAINRNTVRFIIRRYEHRWCMRYWTLKQRNMRHE